MINYFNVEDEFANHLSGWPELSKYELIFGRVATDKDENKSYICVFKDGSGSRDVVSLTPRLRLFVLSGWEGENNPGLLAEISDDVGRLEFWIANNPCSKFFSKVELLGGIIGPTYTKDNRIAFDGSIGLITA